MLFRSWPTFPGGYNPDFGADITDFSAVAGIRGDWTDDFSYDITVRVAENEVEYTLGETINPSLGALSPTSFKPGTLIQEEAGLNIDFVKSYETGNLAFGFEWRNETYEIEVGDLASRQVGPTAAIFGLGSDGFQGFPVESDDDWESDSFAAYIDAEYDVSAEFKIAVAFRYEDYKEFADSTSDFKVAGRYQINDTTAVRATYNTSFRIPTPGQVNTLNVTTTSDSSGNLIPNGTYPVDHPIAVARGSRALEAEDADSFTKIGRAHV